MRMLCLLCGAHSCMTALLYVPFYNPGGTLSGFTGLLSKGREENQLIRASLVAGGCGVRQLRETGVRGSPPPRAEFQELCFAPKGLACRHHHKLCSPLSLRNKATLVKAPTAPHAIQGFFMHKLIQLPDGPESWAHHPIFQKNLWVVAHAQSVSNLVPSANKVQRKIKKMEKTRAPGWPAPSTCPPPSAGRERSRCVSSGLLF